MKLNNRCCLCIMVQNERANIKNIQNNVLNSAVYLIVDGGSQDGTTEALTELDIEFLVNPFNGFAAQRSFLQKIAKQRYCGVVTHLIFVDADETLDEDNIAEINGAVESDVDGLAFGFRFIYCGSELIYAYQHPVVQRLFRLESFKGVDQGAREYLSGGIPIKALHPITHNDRKSGTVHELIKIRANAVREAEWERYIHNPTILRRAWLFLPPIFRSIIYFLFRYIIKLGMIDGRAGLKYLTLNILIYRLLIDYEILTTKK
jgi:glycosyltransferase involved in cell wall biosynthesis